MSTSASPREEVPADALLRYALQQARNNYLREVEAIGQMASRATGLHEAAGWRLDVDRAVWFRARPLPAAAPPAAAEKAAAVEKAAEAPPA